MKRILTLLLLVGFLLAGCGTLRGMSPTAARSPELQAPDPYNLPAAGGAPAQGPSAPMPMPPAGALDETGNPTANGSGGEASSSDRLVIQNADLAIVVADVEARMKQINDMAKEMDGFVVSSNLYQGYSSDATRQVPEAQIVVRVPVEKLEEALKLIKQDVVEVQSETRSGQDVTADYVDLKSRLKNLEDAEAQLEEIMKQATRTEDVVNVFNQLTSYREQIELVKGQMKYYEQAAALSSISVRILAEETIKPVEIGPWQPKGVALRAIQDLVDFSKGFVEFLIRFVLYTLPVLIMIGIPLYLVFLGLRAVLRSLRGKKPVPGQPSVPPVVEMEKKKKK